MRFREIAVPCILAIMPAMSGYVGAAPISLLGAAGGAETTRAPLIEFERANGATVARVERVSARGSAAGSVFSRDAARSYFAPRLGTTDAGPTVARHALAGAAGLKRLIAQAEAGAAGYDAVQLGARIRPGKPPTQMTLAEIFAWIDETPGQPHAIGRYQFIPKTLDMLVRRLGVPRAARFSPQLQDRLAYLLLEDAGIEDFKSGQMRQVAFMNNLAKIWAGLPNSSGRSHYHGYAGNKAVISWAEFEAEIDRLFPRG